MKKSYLTASMFTAFVLVASAALPSWSLASDKTDTEKLVKILDKRPEEKRKLNLLAGAKEAATGVETRFERTSDGGVRLNFANGVRLSYILPAAGVFYKADVREIRYKLHAAEWMRDLIKDYGPLYDANGASVLVTLTEHDLEVLRARCAQIGEEPGVASMELLHYPMDPFILEGTSLDKVVTLWEKARNIKDYNAYAEAFQILEERSQMENAGLIQLGKMLTRLKDFGGANTRAEIRDSAHIRVDAFVPLGASWELFYRKYISKVFSSSTDMRGNFALVFDSSLDSVHRENLLRLLEQNKISYERRDAEIFDLLEMRPDDLARFNDAVGTWANAAGDGSNKLALRRLAVWAPVDERVPRSLERNGADIDNFLTVLVRKYETQDQTDKK